MQVKTKGGIPVITLTKPEMDKLQGAAEIVRELARYDELHPTAGATAEDLDAIAKAFSEAK